MIDLEELGFAGDVADALAGHGDATLRAARVTAAGRERYRLMSADGQVDGVLAGRLRHVAESGALPVVGDWVLLRPEPTGGDALVVGLVPRRTVLVRKHPDRGTEPQVLAANVDLAFVVAALDSGFNPRRIERALAMVHESGAEPVVLLTKRDICDQPEVHVEGVRALAPRMAVHAVSSKTGEGLDEVRRLVGRGLTAALLGASGVGKSTLLNWFLGEQRASVGAVREVDDKGRHTTTARELFVLPEGGMIIDSPGVRELGLWDAGTGVATTFEDIEALRHACRFGDCRHGAEPGCAVRKAIVDGNLDAARLAAYEKLQGELAHDARKVDARTAAEHKRGMRKVFRERKRSVKNDPKG